MLSVPRACQFTGICAPSNWAFLVYLFATYQLCSFWDDGLQYWSKFCSWFPAGAAGAYKHSSGRSRSCWRSECDHILIRHAIDKQCCNTSIPVRIQVTEPLQSSWLHAGLLLIICDTQLYTMGTNMDMTLRGRTQ